MAEGSDEGGQSTLTVRSASRYARKARDDFGKLIADLERDRFASR
ncbi:hypothetical protein [Gandjariella thermophila]|uniref:Resolvase/invertase-type recombinase catalytic domain-containing protein n=1 Tax=Gandjariella thermophila TaxID=1931992 RepID=A0A4D4JFQ5_9PSEU|nr:hypothetical protein [Gandjariella thermophila]GDY33236.1 hypothetical protein GTS_48690 [Gandjariella thermophila]